MKKKLSAFHLFFPLLFFGSLSFADTVEGGQDLEDRDIRALREWIDTKRQISLKEIGGDLSLSGEVRMEFQNTHETANGSSVLTQELTGPSARGFDAEFNFMLDYRNDRTWVSIKLEFDNGMGIASGTTNKISLERAYVGVRAVQGDSYTFDVEFGRRFLSNVFDSKIQFASQFDGVTLRYDAAFEKVGDFYFHFGGFVINEHKDQFGWAGELGLLNIGGTGFYLKGSLVDWKTKDYPRFFENDRFRFVISQITGGYRFKIPSIDKMGIFYSAFLWNYVAKDTRASNGIKAPYGFYVGVSVGQLLKQWDFAFDINYQIVAAQVVPDFDVLGIGLGNKNKTGFYTESVNFDRDKSRVWTTSVNAGGETNYQGYKLSFDILLTDNLNLQQVWEQSWTLDRDIGPYRTYYQYEIELIYTW